MSRFAQLDRFRARWSAQRQKAFEAAWGDFRARMASATAQAADDVDRRAREAAGAAAGHEATKDGQ